jgi:hypothetical protein
MTNEKRDIQRKLRVLQHAEKIGSTRDGCWYLGVDKSGFREGGIPIQSKVKLA